MKRWFALVPALVATALFAQQTPPEIPVPIISNTQPR